MMINPSISTWAAFAAILFAFLQRPDFAAAQQKKGSQTEAPSGAEGDRHEEKRKILDWLDRYQTIQVIFKSEHVEELRAKVSEMSADELHRWLARTAEVRAVLDSDEWRETREWYREFLRVQAIYSDEDIERLREKAAKASPKELYDILMDIKRRRDSLRWMHAASESQRKSNLALWERYQQQVTPDRRTTRGAGYHVGQSTFGPGKAGARPCRASRYHVPPPLVTSREVARWTVWNSILGGYGWRW